MLHTLQNLIGSQIIATDGETGRVRSFLFNDQTWEVRYLVVDVGDWLHRHDVVLPITALQLPDWADRVCSARLTKQQVRDSPDIDTEKPVSRQQELAMRDYYHPIACWVDHVFGVGEVIAAGEKVPVPATEDSHLRSTMHMLVYEVWGTNGAMGSLESFVMDDANWHIGYLEVMAGEWLDNRSVLIPTQWVRSIAWAEFRVYLHYPKSVEPPLDENRKEDSALAPAGEGQGTSLATTP